jgi:glycosyltransferase involved in cell wall biosynthesis
MADPSVSPVPLRPLRILFVLEHYYPYVGGCETLFQNLAEGLVSLGHTVRVVTLLLPGTDNRQIHNGVEIVRVRSTRLARRYLFSLLAIPTALRLARQSDLVHSTTYNAAFPAWVAAALAGRPAALTVHEVFGKQWNELAGLNRYAGYGYRLFEWSVLHLPFAHFFCDSDHTRQRLLGSRRLAPQRASVAYPAIDYAFWDRDRHQPRPLRAETGLPSDAFIYLYFGRPGVSKGLEYLLEAAPRVRDRVPGSYLVLLLAKDPWNRYQAVLGQIRRLGLEEHVRLLDPVPRIDLPGYLLAADCVVVPSVSEGFGYSAAEAALLGCRVIATSGHAVQEVLGDWVHLVPPRNPQALAEAIIDTARKPGTGSIPPKRYDAPGHLAAVLGVYARLLASKSSLPMGGQKTKESDHVHHGPGSWARPDRRVASS